MANTEKNASQSLSASPKKETQHTGLKHSEGKPSGEKFQLANLSLRTAQRLESCMEKMATGDTTEHVKAICMCAGEINKLMRLNLEFYKEGL